MWLELQVSNEGGFFFLMFSLVETSSCFGHDCICCLNFWFEIF